MVDCDSLTQMDWDKVDNDAGQQAMLLTAEILDIVKSGEFSQKMDKFDVLVSQLKELRSQAPHQVNQGLRAVITLMAHGPYRDFVLNEVARLIHSIADRILGKMIETTSHKIGGMDPIDASFGNVEDVLMEAWTKELQKHLQFVRLQQRLQEGERTDQFDLHDLSGIFNPLAGDFLAWFIQVVTNKARDFIKMSARKRAREKTFFTTRKEND